MHHPARRRALAFRTRLLLVAALATTFILTGAAILSGVLTVRTGNIWSAPGVQAAAGIGATTPGLADPPAPAAADPLDASPTGAGPAASQPPEAGAATPTAAAPAKDHPGADPISQVVALVNRERAAAGCKPVSVDPRLTVTAYRHSADMARRAYFSHVDPDGADPGQRITNSGYRWARYGENIAAGYSDPSAVMVGWMHSPGHRANILNCGFRDIGVGAAYDGAHKGYWTQDFGSPR